MGALIMLGTLFGLLAVIVVLVLRYDPQAHRSADGRQRPPSKNKEPL